MEELSAVQSRVMTLPVFTQIVYLDFDGELTKYRNQDLNLDIDVTVEDSRLSQERIKQITDSLNEQYASQNVHFVSDKSDLPDLSDYSTIHVGITSSSSDDTFTGASGDQDKTGNTFAILDSGSGNAKIISAIACELDHLLSGNSATQSAFPQFSSEPEASKKIAAAERYIINSEQASDYTCSIEEHFYSAGSDVVLSAVPQAEYMYGCTATATGMLLGYYDLNGYQGYDFSNLFDGQVELNARGLDGNAYDMDAFDTVLGRGIASEQYVSLYYNKTEAEERPYVFIGNTTKLNTQYYDCVAAYLGTGMVGRGGNDLATSVHSSAWGDGSLTLKSIKNNASSSVSDFLAGLDLYVQAKGYSLNEITTKTMYVDTCISSGGFTFNDYMAEIDAGRPVILHITGHSMIGYGYNASTKEIILDDCYEHDQRMTWGGLYEYAYYARSLNEVTTVVFNTSGLTPAGDTKPDAPTVIASTVYATNQNVTVTAAFSSNSARKQYSYDGNNWSTYAGPIVVSANTTLYFRGISASGTASDITEFVVANIDKTAPVITLTGDVTTSLQSTKLTASVDDGSSIYYSTDQSNWIQYNGDITVTANGTYYFKAEDAAGNTGTNQITFNNIVAPPFENNHSFDTAYFLGTDSGITTAQNAALNKAYEQDYYSFTLTQRSTVTLTTNGNSGSDTQLYLYDFNRQQIAFDDDSGNGYFSKISNQTLDAGTYFVMVKAYGTGTAANYNLTTDIASSATGSLVVTTAEDVVDAYDGVTSLREAVAYAKELGGEQTITFNVSYSNTIVVKSKLVLESSVKIEGSNIATGKNMTIKVPVTWAESQKTGKTASDFHILESTKDNLHISLSNLNFKGGLVGSVTNDCGAVQLDADKTTIAISGCTFSDSASRYGAGGALVIVGAEITATITNSSFRNNFSYCAGGALNITAYDEGKCNVTIDGCKFTNNKVSDQSSNDLGGGALWLFYGANGNNVTIKNTKFVDNEAKYGGAIHVQGRAGNKMTCINTSFTGNRSDTSSSIQHSGSAIQASETSVDIQLVNTSIIGNDGNSSLITGNNTLSCVNSIITANYAKSPEELLQTDSVTYDSDYKYSFGGIHSSNAKYIASVTDEDTGKIFNAEWKNKNSNWSLYDKTTGQNLVQNGVAVPNKENPDVLPVLCAVDESCNVYYSEDNGNTWKDLSGESSTVNKSWIISTDLNGIQRTSENNSIGAVVVGAVVVVPAISDYNGSGKSDMVQFVNGLVYVTHDTASGYVQTSAINDVTGWNVTEIRRDLTGDGFADIQITADAGDGTTWVATLRNDYLKTGCITLNYQFIGAYDNRLWSYLGSADFNGDGKSEILMVQTEAGKDPYGHRNVAGWVTDDTTCQWIDNIWLGALNDGWNIAGTADVTGDGKDNVILRGADGMIGYWSEFGGMPEDIVELKNAGNRVLITTGDFDGDGAEDFLWQSCDNGEFSTWTNVSNSLIDTVIGKTGDLGGSWTFAGTGDYNADGMDELLWCDTSTYRTAYSEANKENFTNLTVIA